MTGTSWKGMVVVALVAYLGLVLFLTLVAFPQNHPTPNLVPFRSMARDIREHGVHLLVNFLGNLGVFAPFGVLLPLVRRGPTTAWQVACWGFLLSAGIELVQYDSGRRVCDVDDVLLNTAGGLLGFAAFRMMRVVTARHAACGLSERLTTNVTSQTIG